MKNTYWNESGKYQEKVNEIYNLMPSWGKTNNPYMNLFLTASKLYYDVYNNGGGNIRDCYVDDIEKYIKPYAEDVKCKKGINFECALNTIIKNLRNEEKLENFLDSVIEFISDKDLSYDKYIAYFDNERELISYEKQEGFNEISFGNKEDFESWTGHRINSWGYKVV